MISRAPKSLNAPAKSSGQRMELDDEEKPKGVTPHTPFCAMCLAIAR
jgi:hypothetical protein